jgi:hypothetical protein
MQSKLIKFFANSPNVVSTESKLFLNIGNACINLIGRIILVALKIGTPTPKFTASKGSSK